jgi:integrase
MQIARLDAELLETFYARLPTCPELCRASADHTCRPPSSSSIRQIHFILRGSGDRGVRWGYLSVNAAALAQPPAPEKTTPDPPFGRGGRRDPHRGLKEPAWGTLLWLVMVTGCRRGELSRGCSPSGPKAPRTDRGSRPAVLDLQFSRLTRSNRARIEQGRKQLCAEWG